MNVGEKINQLRKEKNLTMLELSKKSGISAETLCNWKNGHTKPQGAKLKKVADALECDLKELYDLL